jgi:hypothetical protein
MLNQIMSVLAGKFGVLYVIENDPKSQRAVSIAQHIPEIYVQYVGLLSADKIPPWLKEAPTCVTLSDKKLYVGTEALELLTMIYTTKQQQAQQGNIQQPPQQYSQQYAQQPTQPPQQYLRGAENDGRRLPPPTQYQLSQASYPQQNAQQHVMRPQFNAQQLQGRQTNAPNQMQMTQQMPPQFQQPPPPQQSSNASSDSMIKGSLQPASGTGNYGCSLDTAFMPMEDPSSQSDQQPASMTGKVNQKDIDSYMRLRESMGGQSNPKMLQQ